MAGTPATKLLGGMLVVYPIDAAFKFIPTGLFTYTSNFTLSALPLFILMGTLAFYADLGKDATRSQKAPEKAYRGEWGCQS